MIELDDVVRIVRALNRNGVRYMVFGGAAVNLHGLVRSTEDVDFFVDPSPSNVRQIKRALHALWNDPQIDEIQDDDMVGDYPSFCYNPPSEDFGIDFVSRLGEAFRYEDLEAQDLEVGGESVRVATPQTLYRMKRDTVRPSDKMDALALQHRFKLEE